MNSSDVSEARYCANPHCLVGYWSVSLRSTINQVWSIISQYDDEPFLVAAPRPICPCCADDLLTAFEVEGGFAEQGEAEEGPIFEFIRTLH